MSQVTEKSEAYMDSLQVALELWEKQLVLGAELEVWAAARLAVFAESHPFHSEQHILDMRVPPAPVSCAEKCSSWLLL